MWKFCTQPISITCTILNSRSKGLSILNVSVGSVKIQLILLTIKCKISKKYVKNYLGQEFFSFFPTQIPLLKTFQDQLKFSEGSKSREMMVILWWEKKLDACQREAWEAIPRFAARCLQNFNNLFLVSSFFEYLSSNFQVSWKSCVRKF